MLHVLIVTMCMLPQDGSVPTVDTCQFAIKRELFVDAKEACDAMLKDVILKGDEKGYLVLGSCQEVKTPAKE